jgi:hypothetical protein
MLRGLALVERSGASLPGRRGFAGHWRGRNFGERRDFSCAAVLAGVLFGVFRDGTSEPPFFQSRANDPRR